MKKVLLGVLLIALTAVGIYSCTKQNESINKESIKSSKEKLDFSDLQLKSAGIGLICCVPHRPKLDCEDGWGLCNCQVFPNCPTGGAGFEASLNSVTREIILKNNDDVIKGDTLYIDDDLVLPKDYADSEGYDSITILEGKYLVAHDAGACISVVKVKLD